MKLAVMQPYFFPYIGYFQLIKAVDKFVFYDDVNFIKNGWINRNRIIINGHANYFTIQLKGASSNKLIKDVGFTDNRRKLVSTIMMAYKRAPYYMQSFPVIEKILNYQTDSINELAIYSVKQVCNYLGISTNFEVSSLNYPDSKGMDKAERLKEICQINNSNQYINPIGGQELYKKEDFKHSDINLSFIKTNYVEYKQFQNEFIAGLSIIDIMMFNSIEEIQIQLDNYELI
ncbi:MAG: WbqC family protein [Bacteroidales bacterium]|jgi:hypothetical protein|nr:WbqC family protein [Bacteroidales bacterium]